MLLLATAATQNIHVSSSNNILLQLKHHFWVQWGKTYTSLTEHWRPRERWGNNPLSTWARGSCSVVKSKRSSKSWIDYGEVCSLSPELQWFASSACKERESAEQQLQASFQKSLLAALNKSLPLPFVADKETVGNRYFRLSDLVASLSLLGINNAEAVAKKFFQSHTKKKDK